MLPKGFRQGAANIIIS